ncbi:MAG TPA: TROVE domain-containing protein [Polyangia bacterium]|jgi:60 kDa SS-A/Ro ribonucleoprotein|nr:TROVE domain-containing protein [Polyangia bacterium]
MSRIAGLFGGSARSTSAPTHNREGYPAWSRPLAEQYLQALLTNTLGQTFYASQRELVAEAGALHDAMLAEDPEFVSRALVYARTRGYMRSQPLYGLAKLAGLPPAGTLFESAFGEVVRTPGDLMDFATLVRALRGSEGGRRIKRVAGRWLSERLTEYWVLKYGAERRAGYALADLVRLYHPHRGARLPLYDHLLGKKTDLAALPQHRAFSRLAAAESDAERAHAITEGRLPHEVVTPFARRSPKVWSALAAEMPALALLRHLATLERHGVIEAVRPIVERKLGDARALAGAKILPFRFLQAADKVRMPWLKDVLRGAVELSLGSVPRVRGRTAVMVDRSGSMSGTHVQTAALFGLCLLRQARLDGRFLLFDDRLEEPAVSLKDSLLTQAQAITARGGTDTALPLRTLLEERDWVDNVILITDEQQNTGSPFLDVLDAYRRKVNAEVKVFVLVVAPYRGALLPPDPLTWYLYGWSEQALDFIALASEGWGGMVEHIGRRPH